jgi:hypothetical protein
MTETAEEQDTGGTLWDAPNQQVVRDDASPPWQEGTGGDPGEPVTAAAAGGPPPAAHLDGLTKAELLDYAREIGVQPANNDMTKDELRAGIDAAEGR